MLPLRNFTLACVCLTAITFPSMAQQTQNDKNLEAVFQRINTEVNTHAEGYEQLQKATATIGHRLSGTENGTKAEQFIYDLLKRYGLSNVHFEPFQMQTWQRDTLDLEIVPEDSDNFEPFKAVALAHSPISADVSASIVDVGNGLAIDFEKIGTKVKGKTALCNIGLDASAAAGAVNLHRSEKVALAIKNGAVAVIMVNQAPNDILLTGTASVTGELIPIPAVCVSSNSGKAIRQWLKEEKLIASIQMTNHFQTVTTRNVVATLKGETREKIVVGGHLDCWDLATGAIDNGIGSFSVLEIARTLKALNIKPKRSIEFIFFMGEEQGLHGSENYVAALHKRPKKLNKIKYMMNIDMAGNAIGFDAGGREEAVSFFETTGKLIAATDTAFRNRVSSSAGLHSDHQAFMLEGIPTASPIANLPHSIYNCYHADCDDFKLVEKKYINNTAKFSAMMLYALANSKHLPALRQTETEIGTFLTKNKLREKLEIHGQWRWK